MKRVRMIVAYDGTAYHGWQFQLNGLSIEEVLNEALSALLKDQGDRGQPHGRGRPCPGERGGL